MPSSRITECTCVYKLVNIEATESATLTSSSVQSFCNVQDLLETDATFPNATLEHNFYVLNGSLSELNTNSVPPFFSSTKSGNNGVFTTAPKLHIAFTNEESFHNFTMSFSEDYPKEIKFTLYNNGTVLSITTVTCNSDYYIAPVDVNDCTAIDIEFLSTHIPDRYVKMNSIMFGVILDWGVNEIKSAKLLFENDEISDKVSTNELTMDVVDKYTLYNLANDQGLHQYFMKKQSVEAYEELNGTKIFLGNYYLDSFSVNDTLVKLNCVSAMGLLEDIPYNNGDIYNGTKAEVILDDIFEVAGIENYTIDTVTANTLLYGTIKPCTCREALREVLFACGSTVDSYGLDEVEVHKRNPLILDTTYRSEKFSTKITKNDYVYGVSIEYSNYVKNTESKDKIIDQETFDSGSHTIVFDSPYDSLSITNGTITDSGKYYCVFTVNSDNTQVTLEGYSYEEYTSKVVITNKILELGENETIKEYSGSLCNAQLAKLRANDILKYLGNRLTINIKQLTRDINISGRRWVENPSKNYANFIAWYVSRSFDLTGGFIDDAELVGYYYNDYNSYYSGNSEYFSGESVGII